MTNDEIGLCVRTPARTYALAPAVILCADLSTQARILWIYCEWMSCDPKAKPVTVALAAVDLGISIPATRKAFQELRDSGYLETTKLPNGSFCMQLHMGDGPIAAPVEPPKSNARYSPEFETWWETYPKKTGKGAAYKLWVKLPVNERKEALESLIRHTQAWATWEPDRRQFIPNPATWLHQNRYDDEAPETVEKKTPQTRNFNPPEPPRTDLLSPDELREKVKALRGGKDG